MAAGIESVKRVYGNGECVRNFGGGYAVHCDSDDFICIRAEIYSAERSYVRVEELKGYF